MLRMLTSPMLTSASHGPRQGPHLASDNAQGSVAHRTHIAASRSVHIVGGLVPDADADADADAGAGAGQVLYSNALGLVWNVYLSYQANKAVPAKRAQHS